VRAGGNRLSTATPVPETWELDGDDAWRVLRTCGRRQLLKDAFMRLRVADGFSHARSLAYATSLVFVQAIIAVVGLASALGNGGVSSVVVRTLKAAVPGPGGQLLTQAVTQAHRAGASHRYAGLSFGLVGTLVTGSTLLGQLERGLNRIYGVEQDRPTLQKYGLALALAVTSGALAIAAFALLAFGHTIGNSIDNAAVNDAWNALRWPVAIVLATLAMTMLFRWSPSRRQPALSWLAFGSVVAAFGWMVVTAGLGEFFSLSKSFGQTYGPLAGIVALLVWSLLSAVAVLYGGAVAAQLEAVRAGVREPQDQEKVEHSEPESEHDAEVEQVRS
jgi:YihY family inner membrane protein